MRLLERAVRGDVAGLAAVEATAGLNQLGALLGGQTGVARRLVVDHGDVHRRGAVV